MSLAKALLPANPLKAYWSAIISLISLSYCYKAKFESKRVTFEALYCDLHSKSAQLEKAHLDIIQTAKAYNKEEYVRSHGMTVCYVQWRLGYKYAGN